MFKRLVLTFGLMVGLSSAVAAPAMAADVFKACQGNSSSAVCASKNNNQIKGNNSIFERVVNVLLYITGAIAVIMLVIGGLRYVLSAGDSAAINSAKNTILYALVGIAIAFFAYAIVNFVLDGIL